MKWGKIKGKKEDWATNKAIDEGGDRDLFDAVPFMGIDV